MSDGLKNTRVLILTPSLYRCGPMNDVLRLCRQYGKTGFRPYVAQLNRPRSDSLEKDFRAIGIEIETFGAHRWNMAAHVLKLRRTIQREKIQIVHSVSLRPDLINAAVRSVFPDIISLSTVLNIAIHDTSALAGKIPGRIAAEFWLAAFARMDALAAHSQGIYDYLSSEGLARHKIRVIPNGVDTEHFSPEHKPLGTETRRRLGIAPDEFLLGFVGNFLPVKGLDILLRAFAEFRTTHNASLMLVGDGPEETRLKKLAAELGIGGFLHWVPRCSELRPYYAAMDVFCLPSRSEGLSNALLEAAACALPCIVSDIPGSREVIRNGVNGFLSAPENAEALAAVLTRMFERRADLPSMGAAARRSVWEGYSAEGMAQAYMRLYQHLLSERR